MCHSVYTEQPAALADLLKFVSCKCKFSSKIPCSRNCSCKKNGLYYVTAWGHCHSDGCQNENPTKNFADDICEENDKINIFDIFNLLDT